MLPLCVSSTTIAPLGVDDLPSVIEIERRSNSHPWTERNFQDALSSGYLCLVAHDRSGVCGFSIARILLDEAELLLIAVAPEARRQGVAAHLWIAMSNRLYENGARILHLEVRESNVGAQSFYASRGLVPSGRRKRYYPSGARDAAREDAILMQGALSP